MGYLKHIYSHYYPVTFLTWMSSKVYHLHRKCFQLSHCANIVENGKKGKKGKEGRGGGENRKRFPLSLPLHSTFLLSSQLSRPTVQITIFCPNKKISHVCLCDSKMPAGQQNHGHYYFIIVIILLVVLIVLWTMILQSSLRACLHGGKGPQVGEVTRLGG